MKELSLKETLFRSALVLAMGAAFLGLIVSSATPTTSTKESAKRAVTLSNVKQIVLGNLMYASDFDDTLVLAHGWVDSVMPYIKNEQIFMDVYLYDNRDPEPKYGLALFKPVAGQYIPDILNQDKVPLVFQSSLIYRGASGDLTTLPMPPRNEETHAIGFLDGHAKQFPPTWPESPTVLHIKPKLFTEN